MHQSHRPPNPRKASCRETTTCRPTPLHAKIGAAFRNPSMKYCSQCGNPVTQRIPEGDSRLRFVCDSCHTIHYQNPNIVAGCVPTWGSKVLLCRRAIEPRLGYWTLPAGFMENGETLEQGAAREAHEEALAHVEIGSLLAVANVLHARQVHVFFRGVLRVAEYGAGAESLEV